MLYVRSPQKIPEDLAANASIETIQGQLSDLANIEKAMQGADAVVSLLGPTPPFHFPNAPIAHALSDIVDIMHKLHVRRILIVATPSAPDPNDKFSITFGILVNMIAVLGRNSYKEEVAIGKTIREKGKELDWTLVRVPLLTNKPGKETVAGYVGDGKTGSTLSRSAMAKFMVDELVKPEWVKKAPLVSAA